MSKEKKSLFKLNSNSKDKKQKPRNKSDSKSVFSSKYQRTIPRSQNSLSKPQKSFASKEKKIITKLHSKAQSIVRDTDQTQPNQNIKIQSFKKKFELDKRNKIISKRQKVSFKSKFANFRNKSSKKSQEKSSNFPIRGVPRKKRKFFNKRFLFVLLIPVLLVLIVLAAMQTSLFNINEIDIVGSTQTNTNVLKNYIQKNGGSGLIFNISPARLKKIIEQQFGFVKSATISKDLPGTLRVNIEEYTAKYLVSTQNDSYLVSDTGVVLFNSVDVEKLKQNFPLLTFDTAETYKIKDLLDLEVLNEGLDTLSLAKSENTVNNIVITMYPDKSADASVGFSDGKTWLMTLTKKTLIEQYSILQQLRSSKTNFKTLDTRFAGSYIIK